MKKNTFNTFKRIISAALIMCMLVLPFGGLFTVTASAKGVTELDGTDLNGATVLTENDKYLKTNSYITALDNGYDVSDSTPGHALTKNGAGTSFASFYIDTLGEGGSVLRGASGYKGYDAYGFIAGSGEEVYGKNENGEDILIGKNSIAIKMKYNYSSSTNLTGKDGYTWSICDDTYKSTINGMSGVGVVGKGAVIVEKFVPSAEKDSPASRNDWKRLNEFSGTETNGLHTVNFFGEYSPETYTSPFVLYTPDGDDLQKGVFVRITVAYEIYRTETYKKFLGTGKRNVHKNIVEETVFYLCNTSGEVVFENLYYESGTSEEVPEEEITTSTEQKGGPISNNQGAIDGFRVDMRGWNYDVTYHYNDSTNAIACTDGQVFTDTGKYRFVIRSKIGVIREKTVYIHEKTDARNIEAYFGDGLISSDSIRVFAPGETYPVYVKGHVTVKTENENATLMKHAPIVGRVYLLNGDWSSIDRDASGMPVGTPVAEKAANDHDWSFSDLPAGNYEAVFANNEDYFNGTATGDTYKFVWRFSVAEEGQAPMVNVELLYQQLGFCDYESKHYVTRLATKGAGDLLVVFTDESAAYEFACKYLVSTVIHEDSEYVFDGITYDNEPQMLTELRQKARTMVEEHYYDATDVSTYLTLKESVLTPILSETPTDEEKAEYDAFVGILDRELERDVLVFLSEEYREYAAIGEPFLNDRVMAYVDENGDIVLEDNPIYFISIADFESESVVLYLDGTDVSYSLPYGVPVQAFLESKNAPTGRYRIVESNPSGSVEYHAIYIRRADISTTVTFERVYNNNLITQTLGKVNSGIRLRANNFKITDITNDLDPYGLIKIKKDGEDAFVYQIDEFQSIPVIDEEGSYEITVIDRLGNSATFFIDIFNAKKMYMFTLEDGTNQLLSESAYGGKVFTLPILTSQNPNLEFYGWEDADGNVYNDTYVFNSPENVRLKAVWHYASVNINVYDGDKVNEYTAKVGDLVELPKLQRDGYLLYGYRYVLSDGTIRFYRAQITHVPNVEKMKLDAVWVKTEASGLDIESGSGNTVRFSLIDGDLYNKTSVEKGEILELPTLNNENGFMFVGWKYEYELAGMIFTDECSYDDITSIGMYNENAVKLVAVWTADANMDQSQSAPLAPGLITDGKGNTGEGATGTEISKSVILSAAATLAVGMLALLIAFTDKLTAAFTTALEAFRSRKATRESVRAITYLSREERRKPLGFYKRVLVPCICFLLVFTTIYFAGYQTIAYATEEISDSLAEARELEASRDASEIRAEQLSLIMYDIQSSFGVNGDDLDESEEFLYSNIVVDLLSMGYEDVFTAYAVVGGDTPETDDDKVVEGIGYTAYVDAYEEDGEYIFGAGFVSLANENTLTKLDVESGVVIHVSDEIADGYEHTEFKLAANRSWGTYHYVAYGKYVYYQVLDYVVQYSMSADNGEYIEAFGDVYSYDINDYCHYTEYGEEFELDAYGISSDMDYDQILRVYREAMESQIQSSVDITVEKADFISIQAINDYIAHNQDERFLGVDAETLLYYEANITDTQYYIIYGDGSVDVLELPPDPERKASVWERIAMGVASAGVAVLGVVCCAIPGVGPILGGAMISAALDVFMQTAVGGTGVENIDWVSVGTSAVVGALTGGVGSGLSNLAANAAKTGVKKVLAKLGAEVVAGAFSGAVTYLSSAAMRGEAISFEECMKSMALGAATGAIIFAGGQALSGIASKFGENALKSYTKFAQSAGMIIGGAAAGFVSYATAMIATGQEFCLEDMLLSMGMGALTGALVMVGNKIVKTAKTAYAKRLEADDEARLRNRIKKHLPSENNKNWSYETVDDNGNFIASSKASYLDNPDQKMYIYNKELDIRIEIIDGYPQFSDITTMKAVIDDGIVLDRNTNFEAFDSDLAKQWRKNPDAIPDDFKQYFIDKKVDITHLSGDDIEMARRGTKSGGLGYTWHESEDMHTGYLVKTSVHKTVSHSGGIERLGYLCNTHNYEQLQKQRIYNVLKNINIGAP